MAQIVISTIDPINGSISSTIKLKDDYLHRIYRAYKYNQAAGHLKYLAGSGKVLEASDTIENIINDIPTQHILDELVNRFIKDLVNTAHHTELNIAQTEYMSKIDRIEWE